MSRPLLDRIPQSLPPWTWSTTVALLGLALVVGCADEASRDPDAIASADARRSEPVPADPERREWITTDPVDATVFAEHMRAHPNLERIELFDPAETSLWDWTRLAEQPRLRWVRLESGGGRRLLDALGKQDRIVRLNLPAADLTTEHAAALADLPQLESLRLGQVELTADTLLRLTTLKHLHLLDTTLSDDAVAAIAGLDRLESFYLDRVVVSDAALRSLVRTRPDLHLHIDQLHPDGSGHDR